MTTLNILTWHVFHTLKILFDTKGFKSCKRPQRKPQKWTPTAKFGWKNLYFLTGYHGHFYPHPFGFLFPASSRRNASTSAPPSRDWVDAVRLDTNTQTDWRPRRPAPSHVLPLYLSVMSSPESVMHQHTARSSEKLTEVHLSERW